MPANPRHLALEILAAWKDLAHPPQIPDRGEPASAWVGMTPRDRNLAYELITGVLRRRLLLDAVINSQLHMPPADLELKVRAILWLGVYQLLLHERAPSYATVHSTVELAKNAGRVRAAGLVNAVLRGVTRLKPTLEVRHGLSAATFPRDFSYQIHFNQPVFPDPSTNLVAYLAAVTSHPPELIEMLVQNYGGDDADAMLLRNNLRPALILRVDGTPSPADWPADLVPHEVPGYVVATEGWSRKLEKLIEGTSGTAVSGAPQVRLSPQDPTAGKAIRLLDKVLHDAGLKIQDLGGGTAGRGRILDLCAGLGTKTMQLAATFPAATIVATDSAAEKLHALQERAGQLQHTRIITAPLAAFTRHSPSAKNATPAPPEARDFGVVLLDVPCSNTGVLGRRPQSRWRWPSLDRKAMQRTQQSLLAQALTLLPATTESPALTAASASPAFIVYSTCAIDPAENQQLIHNFIRETGAADRLPLTLVCEEVTLPSTSDDPTQQHDGGYVAILRRG